MESKVRISKLLFRIKTTPLPHNIEEISYRDGQRSILRIRVGWCSGFPEQSPSKDICYATKEGVEQILNIMEEFIQ